MDLSGLWRFQPDPCSEGEARSYHTEGLDTRLWREVEVPCAFDFCGPGMAAYEGVGWFRRTFEVDDPNGYYALRFEGVNTDAKVWVNGEFVGAHKGGYLPFELPFQPRAGRNEVAVRVDSTRRDGDVPGLKRGWRTYGGILREVTLIERPALHLGEVWVRASADGTVTIDANVRNLGHDARIEVMFGIGEFTLGATVETLGAETPVRLAGIFEGPELWSPEEPHLYDADLVLTSEGRVLDGRRLRVGFRTIETRGVDILLNGERIFLKGFNRHEDTARAGMTPDPEQTYRDLVHMKSLGANFVRLCHYPHHPSTLDLCDELGLLVMAEIPLYWWEGGEAGKLDEAKRQLRAMIERDRNHPSIAFWSVSNETHEDVPEVVEGNRELLRMAKELDGNRLVVHISDHWNRTDPHFEDDDAICLNGYPSWPEWGRQDDPAGYWRESILRLREQYPGKPVVITEFGYPALHGVRESAIGEDEQAKAVESEASGFMDLVAGMTLWCYADHPWPEVDFIRYLTTSPFGAVTRDRREKEVCNVLRRLWGAPPFEWPEHQDIYVKMVRRHMRNIPQFDFPEGYGMRQMRIEDAGLWEDVQRDAEPMLTIEPGAFLQAFGDEPQMIPHRVFLITNPRGLAVGTIGAWMTRDMDDREWGRIHWVSVRPSEQGKGLMKAAMTYAMNLLAQSHDRVWLDTSSSRLAAIKVYLDFGFELDMTAPHAQEAKAELEAALNRIL